MRYILLILFLTFGMGCQTMKAKNQARKGWKRVDKEWFGMQAKAPVSKKAAARTPANSGKFICSHFGPEFVRTTRPNLLTYVEFSTTNITAREWLNESCDPLRNFSISPIIIYSDNQSSQLFICCIAK